MRYTVGPFQVNTKSAGVLTGEISPDEPGLWVPLSFLEAVGAELNERVSNLMQQLEEAQQPRPIEQAIAVLAQAWQSAVKPAESERVAVPDVLLEAQRAGWDASRDCGGKVPSCPFPSGTALHEAFRTGWLMEDNGEDRP